MSQPKVRALVVFSGGLDSLLSARLLMDQGIEVEALSFESSFYNAEKARIGAGQLGIKLRIMDISQRMLALTKNPPHGYGKNMNPCLDCHGLMFRLAGELMKKERFDILATGEVLGQRPFSQTKASLQAVIKLAGVDVLRPLSAKLLPETSYEQAGLVRRGRLLRISGRGRDEQQALAKKYGIKDYPTPAGGCLLTDKEYSQRLLRLFDYWPDCSPEDVRLLRLGRILWLGSEEQRSLLVIGRNEAENEFLEGLAQKGDIVVQLTYVNGPLGLWRPGESDTEIREGEKEIEVPEKLEKIEKLRVREPDESRLAQIVSYYAVKARGRRESVNLRKIK